MYYVHTYIYIHTCIYALSMEPTPQAHFTEEIYDIKSWIAPHFK